MRHFVWFAAAAVTSIASFSATAQSLDARKTWYLQAGQGEASSHALVIGTTIPWHTKSWNWGSGRIQGHWDLWAGAWSNRDLRHQRSTTPALGAGPAMRWRGAQGAVPWFAEAGTALMVTGKHIVNRDQRMATRWNFISHIGMGMNFGAQGAHEISLRVQHASNAGIKRPNPGINWLQLRYARSF